MADDEEVRRRQNHGLTRLTRQTRELLLHLGGGGPRGYPYWVRDIEIVRAQAGLEQMVASQRSIAVSFSFLSAAASDKTTTHKNNSKNGGAAGQM